MIKRMKTKLNEIEEIVERSQAWRSDMEDQLKELETKQNVNLNNVNKDFQNQINTVLMERIDEDAIAEKANTKIQNNL